MGYYGRGDYYRGDYYRGDLTGLLKKVGGVVGKVAGAVGRIAGGAAGIAGGVVGRAAFGGPPSPPSGRMAAGPSAPAGGGGAAPPVAGPGHKGFHLNKHELGPTKHRSGFWPKGTVWVRNRHMHVTNVRALRRSARRAHGFLKVASSLIGHYQAKRPKGRAYIKRKR